MSKLLSYRDITLVPRVISTQEHRDGNTSVKFCGGVLDVPIVSSPMPDVTDDRMASALAMRGALGIIHRFQPIETQINQFRNVAYSDVGNLATKVACAIGVTGDYRSRFEKLYGAGCRIFCLDTANGANVQVKYVMEWLQGYAGDKIKTIAGNVATRQGFKFLADLGVDAIRVGIAGGSVCETRTETGVYYPMVSSILDCCKAKYSSVYTGWEEGTIEFGADLYPTTALIADGGIKEPSDMCKALAVGADVVMCGSIFAGTKDAPGDPIFDANVGKLYKKYRGAASFGVQRDYKGDNPRHVEGREILVEYKREHASEVISRFKEGLQSSMSYMDATDLEQFRYKVGVEVL